MHIVVLFCCGAGTGVPQLFQTVSVIIGSVEMVWACSSRFIRQINKTTKIMAPHWCHTDNSAIALVGENRRIIGTFVMPECSHIEKISGAYTKLF